MTERTIRIHPALQDALGLARAEAFDYFALLGVPRSVEDPEAIDRALLERSRVLRQWQNSPQHGPEVVRLLSLLHRVAKILKDPARRRAYREELERAERGERLDAAATFEEMVRAALADDRLDAAARKVLTQFADDHGIAHAQAQQIVQRVREELAAQRAATAPAAPAPGAGEEWEFRIAGEGPEAFELMMSGMDAAGQFDEQTPAKLIAQAGKYNLSPQQAAELIARFQRRRYQAMVRRAASGGVVRDHQIALLAAKAAAYGIDAREACELMSEYTLSAGSPEELAESIAAAESFGAEDIELIVEDKVEAVAARGRRSLWALVQVPDWLRNLGLIAVGGALLIVGFQWIADQWGAGTRRPVPPPPSAEPTAPPTAGPTPSPPVPTPGGGSDEGALFVALPDPPSGLLRLDPERPGDPPAFEIGIAEVTNAQYDAYLRATLVQPPAHWGGGRFPPGMGQHPVNQLTWAEAMAYCRWFAVSQGWPPESVRVPTHAEFLRAVRGRTTRGAPDEPGYWGRARLHQRDRPQAVKLTQWDKIFLAGIGQMYDLLGNVAEWGWDERDGRRALLGGDYEQKDPNFNPLALRWADPATRSPAIGFRVVHVLTP